MGYIIRLTQGRWEHGWLGSITCYSHLDQHKVQRMTDQKGNQQNEQVAANFYSDIQNH